MYNLSCVLLFMILLCSYFFLIIMFLCILKHGSDGKELSKEVLDLTLHGIMKKKKKKTSNLVRKIVQLDNFLKTFPVVDEWPWVGLHPITILTVKDLELCIDFFYFIFFFLSKLKISLKSTFSLTFCCVQLRFLWKWN